MELIGCPETSLRNYKSKPRKIPEDLRTQCEKRENQQDATIRSLLSISVSTCFGHHYTHLQDNKDRVLLHVVYCPGSAGCGW